MKYQKIVHFFLVLILDLARTHYLGFHGSHKTFEVSDLLRSQNQWRGSRDAVQGKPLERLQSARNYLVIQDKPWIESKIGMAGSKSSYVIVFLFLIIAEIVKGMKANECTQNKDDRITKSQIEKKGLILKFARFS